MDKTYRCNGATTQASSRFSAAFAFARLQAFDLYAEEGTVEYLSARSDGSYVALIHSTKDFKTESVVFEVEEVK